MDGRDTRQRRGRDEAVDAEEVGGEREAAAASLPFTPSSSLPTSSHSLRYVGPRERDVLFNDHGVPRTGNGFYLFFVQAFGLSGLE
nr:hypothetical protein CFP56_24225 [Quercus suber]